MSSKWITFTLGFWMLLAGPAFAGDNVTPEPVEREHYIYYFDNPGYISLADSVLESTRRQLIGLIHDSLDYRPKIYIIDSPELFSELIGTAFPDWGAAAALPYRHLVAIKSPDNFNTNRPLKELLAHEYTHLVLHHRTGLYSPPRWFDEGLCMLVSMEWSWSNNLAMSRAAVFGQFLSLRDIENVNRFGESKAQVAYAESYLAVQYLFEDYDVTAVNIFLDRLAEGASVDDALMASIGGNYDAFEREFHIFLSNRFNVVSLFMDTLYFWIALAVIVVVGGILKMRRKKKYYRKLEDEEKYQSTDFDYGDSDNPEEPDDDEPWRS